MIAMADQGGGWRSGGARLALWGALAVLLSVPGIAMRLSPGAGFNWSPMDFAVMGVLLGGVGLGVELVVRASSSLAWRAGAVVAVLSAFLTIWVNLAVGMIGNEDNPYNFIFLGVLALALAGALLARFRAAGMAKAMLAAAIAQAAAGAAGMPQDGRGGAFSLGFALFWLLAAGLFALASRPTA
ncbi:MAG: hypothetical protein QOJ94_2923 [Sphingomonadales bacterium]|jgi:hypothetical protein|nr:hypothetical protein [Sphingomonadales bacterium]